MISVIFNLATFDFEPGYSCEAWSSRDWFHRPVIILK